MPIHPVLPLIGEAPTLSFKALSWAIEQSDVSGNDKYVLILLAYRDNGNEPHGCFPSLRRLSKDCGIDKATVLRALRSLILKGKITASKRRKPNGDAASTLYSFPHVWVVAPCDHGGSVVRTMGGSATRTESKDLTVIKRKPPLRFNEAMHGKGPEGRFSTAYLKRKGWI